MNANKHLDFELTKKLPPEVKEIFSIFLLKQHDSIRLVGGCVRDLLIAGDVKDFDFATKFLPDETIQILREHNIKAIPTGVKFGTITAVINQKHFEITTLRKDNEQDGRHCEPQFVDDYQQDAARRDFTVNALYMNDQGLVYDYFEGINDLAHRKIRFIGDAKKRIEEDYLRILRFFRFSARFAKMLDHLGLQACVHLKENIKKLSADRIRNELFRIISDSKNDNLLWILNEIEETQIRAQIFSATLNTQRLSNLLDIEQAFKIKLSTHVKFAALVIDENVNMEEISARLNFSNQEKKYFNFLKNTSADISKEAIRQLLTIYEKDFVIDFCFLNFAKNSAIDTQTMLDILQYVNEFSLPQFPLNGNDFVAFGIEGRALGDILAKGRQLWVDSDFTLSKEQLLKQIIKLY